MGQGEAKVYAGNKYRLLLVGMTGSGKSATGNSILGFKAFHSVLGLASGTQKCSLRKAYRDNINLEVVDTPGFRDKKRSDEEISRLITQFLAGLSPGPHAVLIVMNANLRFTEDMEKAYTEIKKVLAMHDLGSRIVLVFTCGDILAREGETIERVIAKAEEQMKELMKDANKRYVLFDNKATGGKNTKQLIDLLGKVHEACRPDFSYLSSKEQEHIEQIISNESQQISKNENISLEEAHYKVRQALVEADEKDKKLQEATAPILAALQRRTVEVNLNLCTVL